MRSVRSPAVAGSWYPAEPDALARQVDEYLSRVGDLPRGTVTAIIAPHAGLVYSGPVAAWSYRLLVDRRIELVVLVGPSHYATFEGIAVDDRDTYETPLGTLVVSSPDARALIGASAIIRANASVHRREHSLEMQLPFLQRVLPDVPILPMLMGAQTRSTVDELARALVATVGGRDVLLVASTDLSHFFDTDTAARLDARVIECVDRFDPDGFMDALEQYPEHERGRFVACGGGPTVAVMRAALALGATDARVLRHADSGDVSGDRQSVVGYLAAVLGAFSSSPGDRGTC